MQPDENQKKEKRINQQRKKRDLREEDKFQQPEDRYEESESDDGHVMMKTS